VEEPRKKKSAVTILLVGGGAAIAGVVLAAGGGGDATTTSTTSATAGTTTTTTTTTTVPATTTTTTAPPAPSCDYSMTPGSQSFSAQAQDGTCRVIAPGGCRWSVEATREWLSIQGAASGAGSATVTFHMTANTDKDSRDGRVRLRDTDVSTEARCEIVQAGAGSSSMPGLVWMGPLDVAGGSGQIVVDGAAGAFQERVAQRRLRVAAGDHRIEGLLVTGDGRPGTWRFELAGSFAAGSLQPIAGDVLGVTVDAIVFRVSGRPGERIGFVFRTDR